DVEAYGKVAEYCESKAKKGRGVRVVGRLKQDVWKDSEGKTVSKVFVVAEHIEYKPLKKPVETPSTQEESKTQEPSQPQESKETAAETVTVANTEAELAEAVAF
ncbi:MAG: single-stranded DNA-binding protein, partial [Treponema sp.]|nr:single-stranded DNA-binding protein [Treponema sp.]